MTLRQELKAEGQVANGSPLGIETVASETPLPFEAIVERLESIAKKLEGSDLKLEEALGLFEEGVRLSKHGTKRLDEAERRLEILLENDRPQAFEVNDAE